MTRADSMGKVSRASMVGSAMCATLLVVALVGCGSSGSTSTAGSGATTLAPASGPKLDLAAVKATTEQADVVETHMTVSFSSGAEDATIEQIFTTSRSAKRIRIENRPSTFGNGYTMISGVGNDFYVKGSQGWTKLTLDPSLVEAAEGLAKSTSLVDAVGTLASELRQDGTVTKDGVTLKRYRANVDGNDVYTWFKDRSPLKQMAAQMPEISDAVGSVEVGVDDAGFARTVDIRVSFSDDGDPGKISISTVSKPLPAGSTVDPPPAGEVTSTKTVTTMDELGAAMQAAMA